MEEDKHIHCFVFVIVRVFLCCAFYVGLFSWNKILIINIDLEKNQSVSFKPSAIIFVLACDDDILHKIVFYFIATGSDINNCSSGKVQQHRKTNAYLIDCNGSFGTTFHLVKQKLIKCFP
jgi:hypothetical protein